MATRSLDEVLDVPRLFEQLTSLTRQVSALPEASVDGGDFDYYRATFSEFSDVMGRASASLLDLGAALVTQQHKAQRGGASTPAITATTVVDEYSTVVDVIDGILEAADMALDELSGRAPANLAQAAAIKTGQAPLAIGKRTPQTERLDYRLMHAAHLPRPQDSFADKIDNTARPFVPRLLTKPHSLKPFDRERFLEENAPGDSDEEDSEVPEHVKAHMQSLGLSASSSSTSLTGSRSRGLRRGYPHPYEDEIRNISYPAWLFKPCKERMYLPLERTKCTWVSEPAQLKELLDKLRGESEIAVDLEHHSYRSFQGFLCLMQLSTRTEDFLVDTIALRTHLQCLNEVFADPGIVKVLHGADSDIVWLQRDFGVYIVNLFDTGQAARVLEMPSFSLAHLLQRYANVLADKKYQTADWRIRPLPAEMAKYAQEDTHYLLYIFDRLRNELLSRSNADSNLLRAVLRRSEEVALKRYEIDLCDEDAYTGLLSKYHGDLSAQQLAVFKALYAWRDRVAREQDESTAYVLSNQPFFRLVQQLPTTAQAVLASLQPVPALVRANADAVAKVIADAIKSIPSTAAIPAQLHLADQSYAPAALERVAARMLNTGAAPFVATRHVKIAPAQGGQARLWADVKPATVPDGIRKTMETIHKTLLLAPQLSDYLKEYTIITSQDLAEGKTARGVAMPAAGVFVAHALPAKQDAVPEEEQKEDEAFVLSKMRAAERAAAGARAPKRPHQETDDENSSSSSSSEDSDGDSDDDSGSSSSDRIPGGEVAPAKEHPQPAKRPAVTTATAASKAKAPITPFDYSQAKSTVLTSASDAARKVAKDSFNPYALAPGGRGNRGPKRSKHYVPGGNRSATFRK